GLALNNGCQVSNSVSGHALDVINKAFSASLLAFGFSLQAINGNTSAYDSRVHAVRPHPGQTLISEVISNVISGSKFLDTEKTRVQDAYSFRCFPQVAGSAYDILKLSEKILSTEMNSATDNPLLFEGDGDTLDSISGGNFHGAPIAHASDIAAVAAVDLASISERRVFRLITNRFSGLPSFLTSDPGVSSGLMIAQYTAANLVSHAKSMCFPGSVDTIPTCEGQEDHVSMAPVSAFKLLEIAENYLSVVAIEILTACQAITFRAMEDKINENEGLSELTRKAFFAVRDVVPFLYADEPISPHIRNIENMIHDGKLDFLTPLL
ncbi:MAG: aromatic amino acid lyase, partial [Caldisericia bacterium]